MTPFDRHAANTGEIEARAADFERLAGKALDLKTVTDKAFKPAEADWDGMCAEELRAAPEPLRRDAQESSAALAWAAAPLRYWEGRVKAFNTEVDRITGDLAGGAKDHYGAKGVDGKPPTDADVTEARLTAEAGARQKWWTAYNTDIVEGAGTAAGMFRDGPTEANLKAARDAGALPSTPGVFSVFPAYWHEINMEAAAKRADELAKKFKDPTYHPTNAELEELRNLVRDYGKDKVFAYNFLNDLGPRGLLELNGALATYNLDRPGDDVDSGLLDPQSADLVRDLQIGLGVALATATTATGTRSGPRGENYYPGKYELSNQWVTDLMIAGRSKIDIGDPSNTLSYVPGLYGYQLLGPLLYNGDYDARFLSTVGGDIVDFEIAQGKNSNLWNNDTVDDLRLDWTHGHTDNTVPAGHDPVTALMDALSRNGDGARDLFTGVTTYTSDGPEGGRLPRLDYLLTDRDWKPLADTPGGIDWAGELTQHGDDYKSVGLDKLGIALEHATTDHAGPDARRLVESIIFETNVDEQASGYENGVRLDSEHGAKSNVNADLIHPEIRDSMANIIKAYIFDVNRNISDSDGAIPGQTIDVSQTHLVRFLTDLGKDEGAHQTVAQAEGVYAVAEYGTKLDNPAITPALKLSALDNISSNYGHVLGALDYGATVAEHETSAEKDAKYNESVEDRYAIISKVVDQVVGKATDKIPVPVVGDLAGEFVSDVVSQAEEQAKVDNLGRTNYQVGEMLGGSRATAANLVEAAYYNSGPPDLPPRLLVDGHPKPIDSWDREDIAAWQAYKEGPGTQAATAANHAGDSYQNGVAWAETIIGRAK
ncbi:hypothetical protein [Actinoplanes sp. HUAS TT8]|uniref:hypothetical protein n=1 Tax=Actinoplanes sp. HUAS TT8 TaxID=3447453 RepID=UPI003F52265B